MINIANGFIGLTIPPGVETISLNYAPQRRLYLQLLSWIAVSMLTSFAMWFYFRNVRFYSNLIRSLWSGRLTGKYLFNWPQFV